MSSIVEIKKLNSDKNNNLSLNIEEKTFTTILCSNSPIEDDLKKYLSASVVAKIPIKILGLFLNSKNIRKIRKNISFISENPDNYFVSNNVLENINFFLSQNKVGTSKIDKKVEEFFSKLDCENLLDLPVSMLSGGQKQIVGIFLAISLEPKLLVLDNATTMIDSDTKEKLFKILHQLNKNGMTIINFTNNSEDILYSDNVILLKDNSVVLDTKVKNLFKNVKEFTGCTIKLPFIIELSNKLSYYKVIDKSYFDIKKLVNDLWK